MGTNNENTEAGENLTGMRTWVCFPEPTEIVAGKTQVSCFTDLTRQNKTAPNYLQPSHFGAIKIEKAKNFSDRVKINSCNIIVLIYFKIFLVIWDSIALYLLCGI